MTVGEQILMGVPGGSSALLCAVAKVGSEPHVKPAEAALLLTVQLMGGRSGDMRDDDVPA